MKATIDNVTGLMIESQDNAANNATLLANAAALGYKNVSIRVVNDAEHKALIDARNVAHRALGFV